MDLFCVVGGYYYYGDFGGFLDGYLFMYVVDVIDDYGVVDEFVWDDFGGFVFVVRLK